VPVSTPAAFINPAQAPISLTGASIGEVIGVKSVNPVVLGVIAGSAGGGSGNGCLGPAVVYASASGTSDPGAGIAGFTAATASAQGTGRLNVTLSGNSVWDGLPAGFDGQQLTVLIVAGNFTLQFPVNQATAGSPFLANGTYQIGLDGTLQLYMDTTLNAWVVMP
jgi:hypothetical protein